MNIKSHLIWLLCSRLHLLKRLQSEDFDELGSHYIFTTLLHHALVTSEKKKKKKDCLFLSKAILS